MLVLNSVIFWEPSQLLFMRLTEWAAYSKHTWIKIISFLNIKLLKNQSYIQVTANIGANLCPLCNKKEEAAISILISLSSSFLNIHLNNVIINVQERKISDSNHSSMGFNKDVSFFYSYLLLLDNLQRKERCFAIKLGRAGLGREPPGCAGRFCVAPVPSLPSISV